MIFNHIQHKFPKIVAEEVDGKRLYLTPNGQRYPSVTTVLGDYNKEGILEWRKKVGEEQANKISRTATTRGSAVHKALEGLILNEEVSFRGMLPNVKSLFVRMKKEIVAKVNNIHCLETQMFSHRLGVAGTVDCIAEYKNVLSVIDFKTSVRLKKKENIASYFMQTVAYADMFMEHTSIPITQVVVLIGVDTANFCQTMIVRQEEMQQYREKFAKEVLEYKRKNNLLLG